MQRLLCLALATPHDGGPLLKNILSIREERLMFSETFLPLIAAVEHALGDSTCTVLAIDGMAASGKTTLAAALSKKYGAPVIHMDDFFLRPEQRTPQRYAQPGGNIDRERFLSEVCPHLRDEKGFSYFRFDCHRMCLSEQIVIPARPLLLVEGTYSLYPAFLPFYSLKVMLTIPKKLQKERILKRDGEEGYQMFAEKWIPLEDRYFLEFNVISSADFVFNG